MLLFDYFVVYVLMAVPFQLVVLQLYEVKMYLFLFGYYNIYF